MRFQKRVCCLTHVIKVNGKSVAAIHSGAVRIITVVTKTFFKPNRIGDLQRSQFPPSSASQSVRQTRNQSKAILMRNQLKIFRANNGQQTRGNGLAAICCCFLPVSHQSLSRDATIEVRHLPLRCSLLWHEWDKMLMWHYSFIWWRRDILILHKIWLVSDCYDWLR